MEQKKQTPSALKRALRALTVGTALTTMMATGTVGLATPTNAEASEEGRRNTMIGIVLGTLGGLYAINKMTSSSGGGAQTVDDHCGRNYTTTSTYGTYYNQSRTESVNCPPRPYAQQAAPVYQQQAAPQYMMVAPPAAPARSAADIERDRAELEKARNERLAMVAQSDAEFYKLAGAARMEQQTGFCMNITDPASLDAPNREHCGAVLSRTEKGRTFLIGLGRDDLVKPFARAALAMDGMQASAAAGEQCTTETVKETMDPASGKVTGRTVEKVTKPCSLKN